jgi:hypothetical protein
MQLSHSSDELVPAHRGTQAAGNLTGDALSLPQLYPPCYSSMKQVYAMWAAQQLRPAGSAAGKWCGSRRTSGGLQCCGCYLLRPCSTPRMLPPAFSAAVASRTDEEPPDPLTEASCMQQHSSAAVRQYGSTAVQQCSSTAAQRAAAPGLRSSSRPCCVTTNQLDVG